MKKLLILLCLTGLLFIGCKDDEDNRPDVEKIEEWLTENGFEAEQEPSGIYYIELEAGNGDSPSATSDVNVSYAGSYLDGTSFDSGTATFNLQQVIPGFREGLLLMSQGETGIIVIPSDLGYGSNPPSGIRSNAVLVFETVLNDF